MSRSYRESVRRSITPSFSYYEKAASREPNPTSQSAKALEHEIPYTGTGFQAPRLSRHSTKSSLKKAGPIAFVLTAFIAFAFAMIFFITQIGTHVQELLTVEPSRDYGTYQMLSRATTKQILSGKLRMTNKFKSRLEDQGFTIIKKDIGYDLKFNDVVASSDNFTEIINNNPEFRNAFTRAKRGRIANFFDDRAMALYKKLGISRNVFRDYEQTGDPETDAENYQKTYAKQFSTDAETHTNLAEESTTTDEDGNETTTHSSGEDINTKSVDGDSPSAKATSYIQSVSNRVADGLSAAEVGCAVLKVGNMVSIAVSTYEMYQSIHQFMIQMETVSKTMAGEGNNAALNSQNNAWTREATTTYIDATTGEEKTVTGSFMQSEGIKSVSGEPVNLSMVKNYSTERSLLATFSAIATNRLSTTACSTISAANSAISLATLAIPGSGFVKIAINAIKQVALSATLQVAISGLISTLVPIVAQTLFSNPTELIGIPYGEQTVKGASSSAYLTATANSAFTPSSKERSLEANKVNRVIIAQEAEEDRLNRSPLDTSSPNTFLGSLATKVTTLSTSNNIFSNIVKLSSLTTSSLLPSTFADGENSSYLSTFGDCPTADEYSIASDIYCLPTTASDPSTIELEDDDPAYQNWLSNNVTIDDNGNQTILPGSFLAEFTELVVGRESLPGNLDSGIADRALDYATGGVSEIADKIPYVSDALEIFSFLNNEEIEAWGRGTICKNSADNPRWDSDCKYAQHYIQKTRILNQIGYYEDTEDPVLAFQSQSDYLNPTDTSRVAVFARLSGLSREDADFTLALLDYTSYLATYSPENTYIFGDNANQFELPQANMFLGVCGGYDRAQAPEPRNDGREGRDPRNISLEVARIDMEWVKPCDDRRENPGDTKRRTQNTEIIV